MPKYPSPHALSPLFDFAVVIGRFQPVHQGHVALLQMGLQCARHLVVAAGSAKQPRSFKNPFTFEERKQMLLDAVPAADRSRVQVVAVRDEPYDDHAWLQLVQNAVYAAIRAQGGDPVTARVALLGHMKDSSSYYLRIFPNWQWLPFDNVAGIDATAVRSSYFAVQAHDADATNKASQPPFWQKAGILPASTIAFLQSFAHSTQWQALHDEWVFLQNFRQQKKVAEDALYAPPLRLVQVAVFWRGQVLLQQRTQQPGQGNWALPEVLLQAGESLHQAAARALQAIGIAHAQQLLDGISHMSNAAAVFDQAGRNQLGDATSHAFAVVLPDDATDLIADVSYLTLALNGTDKKNGEGSEKPQHHVRWLAFAPQAWADMQELLHEDHYFITRHFVNILFNSPTAA